MWVILVMQAIAFFKKGSTVVQSESKGRLTAANIPQHTTQGHGGGGGGLGGGDGGLQ